MWGWGGLLLAGCVDLQLARPPSFGTCPCGVPHPYCWGPFPLSLLLLVFLVLLPYGALGLPFPVGALPSPCALLCPFATGLLSAPSVPVALVVGWCRGLGGADGPCLGLGGFGATSRGLWGCRGHGGPEPCPGGAFPMRSAAWRALGRCRRICGGASDQFLDGVEAVGPLTPVRPPCPPHPAPELLHPGGGPPGEVGGRGRARAPSSGSESGGGGGCGWGTRVGHVESGKSGAGGAFRAGRGTLTWGNGGLLGGVPGSVSCRNGVPGGYSGASGSGSGESGAWRQRTRACAVQSGRGVGGFVVRLDRGSGALFGSVLPRGASRAIRRQMVVPGGHRAVLPGTEGERRSSAPCGSAV